MEIKIHLNNTVMHRTIPSSHGLQSSPQQTCIIMDVTMPSKALQRETDNQRSRPRPSIPGWQRCQSLRSR